HSTGRAPRPASPRANARLSDEDGPFADGRRAESRGVKNGAGKSVAGGSFGRVRCGLYRCLVPASSFCEPNGDVKLLVDREISRVPHKKRRHMPSTNRRQNATVAGRAPSMVAKLRWVGVVMPTFSKACIDYSPGVFLTRSAPRHSSPP